MGNVSVTQDKQAITVRTADVELAFSLDDGGLRVLRRRDGTNMVGHGSPLPAIDAQVGIDGTWLAERVFVRYLRHSVQEQGGAVEIAVVIGIGPLMITDRFHITGTLIARTVEVQNTSEDAIRLRGIRLIVPWARVGEVDTCRFEAPGNNVRPRLPFLVAAAQRRGVLPRRFFAPGLVFGRAIEQAPTGGAGLLALYDIQQGESLLCWYAGQNEVADAHIEGNDQATTLVHQVAAAQLLGPDTPTTIGTQYLLLLREGWTSALQAYRHTTALLCPPPPHDVASWPSDATFYEVYAGQFGGFQGLANRLDDLHQLGVTTLCLLPIWSFFNPSGQPWNENWDDGDPYAICDFEQIDPSLGDAADLLALTTAAHSRGMRVIVDLPLVGAAATSRYVADHPEWFCRDDHGLCVELPDAPDSCVFDWAHQEARTYWREQAVRQAQTYGFDGYRLVVARRSVENWSAPQGQRVGPLTRHLADLAGRLRADIRAFQPGAVIISPLGGPNSGVPADVIADELAHHQFMHLMLNRLSPQELGTWLEDAAALRIDTTPRLAFVESYRTFQLNPLADGMRGSLLSRAALAGLVFCGFVPMIRSGQEECDHEYIQQLLAARAAYPVLRHGQLRLNGAPCNDPQVFAVLRSLGDTHLLGMIKVGARKRAMTLSLPVDELGLADGMYALFDVLRNQRLAENGRQYWNREELLALQLTLEPYEAYGLIIEHVDQPIDLPTTSFAPAVARHRRTLRPVVAALEADPDAQESA